MNNKASAEKMFSSTKNVLTGSSKTEASVVDKEVEVDDDVYSGLVRFDWINLPARFSFVNLTVANVSVSPLSGSMHQGSPACCYIP